MTAPVLLHSFFSVLVLWLHLAEFAVQSKYPREGEVLLLNAFF